MEFCGGTHVNNTSALGLFKIKQEGSVASGVRRIEAVTGKGVLDYLNNAVNAVVLTSQILHINNPKEIVAGAERIAQELKDKTKEIESLKSQVAGAQINALIDSAPMVEDTKVITSMFVGTTPDMLKTMCDKVTDKVEDAVIVLAAVNGEKLTFVCACSKKAIAKGLKAGDIVKKVAMIAGGNGGGKPDMAMAGGKNVSATDDAIFAVEGIVKEILAK